MRVALLIPPRDFRDESVSHAKLLLEKWDVGVTITSYSTHECVGAHGAVYTPDINAGRLSADEYDALILIDGHGVDNPYKLYDFRPLLDLVKVFYNQKKTVCAINNAMKIIARANIISGVKVAMPKDEESMRLVQLYRGVPSENEIEFDKNILTLNNPELVEDFVDKLLERLGVR